MSPEALLPGDRIPNAQLHEHDGGTRSLYGLHRGKPLLLVVLPQDGQAAARMLDALQAQDAEAGEALAVTSTDVVQPLWDGGRSTVMVGPDAWLQRLAGDDVRGVALTCDRALRVRERQLVAEGAFAAALTEMRSISPASEWVLRSFAPVLQVPAVLEPALCEEVLRYFRDTRGGGEPSGVLGFEGGKAQFKLDPSIKMRREIVIEDKALEQRVHERVGRRVLPEIRRVFNFAVTGREHFKVISYAAGKGYFRIHRDNDTRDVAQRRFAMTLNLNTGEYEGGLLRFPEFGDELYQTPSGGATVFSCSLLHEATDVTAGMRYAMTSFFFGRD